MDKGISKAAVALMILLFIILTHSSLVHSHELARSRSRSHSQSPSPAPMVGEVISRRRGERAKKGSYPARCHSKCNQCKPCMPVEVSIRSMELKEGEYYYPQVWKCVCGDDVFSP